MLSTPKNYWWFCKEMKRDKHWSPAMIMNDDGVRLDGPISFFHTHENNFEDDWCYDVIIKMIITLACEWVIKAWTDTEQISTKPSDNHWTCIFHDHQHDLQGTYDHTHNLYRKKATSINLTKLQPTCNMLAAPQYSRGLMAENSIVQHTDSYEIPWDKSVDVSA